MLSFRNTKKTSKNVADTTFKKLKHFKTQKEIDRTIAFFVIYSQTNTILWNLHQANFYHICFTMLLGTQS